MPAAAPRPNLFLVGSMKAGTTSLARHLRAHPQIFMASDPKEPTWFLTREQLLDVLPGVEKRGFWRGEEHYLQLFAKAGDRPIIGEASANYARLPRVEGVVDRIAQFNSSARIVFIMRDPVERTISHYWYMVRFFAEHRDMLSAIREDSDYTATSNYALQLRPYLDRFGVHNVLTLTTEQLSSAPEATMAGVFRWLGIDDAYVPPAMHERDNEAPPVIIQVRGSGALHRFRHSRLWNALGPHIPASVRRLGRRVSERPVARRETPLNEVHAYLRGVHRPQVVELERMLCRKFPEWTTLSAES